jgi:pimeloyl-ACP methyl ester carboxylesterase
VTGSPADARPEIDTVRRLLISDGAVLGYRIWQPGAPRRVLVLLHGVASNMTRWSEFMAKTTLRDSWDLLRVDLRGNGLSVNRGRIGMTEWCADLAAILDTEGYSHAVMAGHCLGAQVALEFAVRHPQRTAGLVLIEPTLRQALVGRMRQVARLRPLFGVAVWLMRALNAAGIHRRRLDPLDLEELDRRTRSAISAGGAAEALLARYASPWHDLRSTPSAAYLQALIATGSPPPQLSAITVPVLALLSSASTFSDPAITKKILARLPTCRIVMLDARHWIPTEQPDAMRRAIEDWCVRFGS